MNHRSKLLNCEVASKVVTVLIFNFIFLLLCISVVVYYGASATDEGHP